MEKRKTDLKNKIVLWVGCFENKKRIELFNFEKVDHVAQNGVSFVRVCCDGRFYYYKTIETRIGEIIIY